MRKSHPLAIAAATDGACSGNPGPGGWAGLIRFEDGSVEEFGGREKATTNNRMELQAALETLERLKDIPKHPNLTIKTDSKYLINGFSKWMNNWKKKGWLTSSGKAVLNKDLWEALDSARLGEVQLEYVKGHSGECDNERVDQIAVSFSKGLSISLNHKNIDSKDQKISIKDLDQLDDKMQKLLSRLEIIDKFSKNGFGLTSEEIAELTNLSIENIQQINNTMEWREWIIESTSNGLWRIKRNAI